MHDDMGAALGKICLPLGRCCTNCCRKTAQGVVEDAVNNTIHQVGTAAGAQGQGSKPPNKNTRQGSKLPKPKRRLRTELPTAAEMATPHNITWSSDTRITAVDLARGTMGQTKSLGTMGHTKSLYSEGHVSG
jgi:hypothetical protein